MNGIGFAKGQGTLNDFVLVADADDELGLTPAMVRALCDRRAGIGGDGVLRAVRGRHVSEWAGDPGVWFMDYRNADGSVAEMCGNGLRVFTKYLVEEGLAAGPVVDVGTRAGLRRATLRADGLVEASMGPVTLGGDVLVTLGERTYAARVVDVGNPHAVAFVDAGVLDGLDLSVAPSWRPAEAFPEGVNCEFVEVLGEGRLRMRVYERGVGETFSCGTGVVASAAAYLAGGSHGDGSSGEVSQHFPRLQSLRPSEQARYALSSIASGLVSLESDVERLGQTNRPHGRRDRFGLVVVEVQGGELEATIEDHEAKLTGPAVIVARGEVYV